jgi:hypothetical protein
MLVKAKVLEKAIRGKGVANSELSTKLILIQSNAMEAKFAQLKALVMNMVAQVKSNAFGLEKVRDQKNTSFSNLNVNPRYFCGA